MSEATETSAVPRRRPLAAALCAAALAVAVAAAGLPDRADGRQVRRCGKQVTPHGAVRAIRAAGLRCTLARALASRWVAGAHDRPARPGRIGSFRCAVRARNEVAERVLCGRRGGRAAFIRPLPPERLPKWRPFSAASPFNVPIPDDPEVDAGSQAFVDGIRAAIRKQDATVTWRFWSVPVYYADADTPRHPVRLTARWAPRRWLTGVPIPPFAQSDPEDDAEMAIVDLARRCEYDFWQIHRRRGGWRASWGNAIPTGGSGIFPKGLSARGSGFALLGGLIQPHELRRGYIDHALVWSYFWPRRGGPVAPATESDGVSQRSNALPEGARVQLDPSLDLDPLGLRPYERTIARALQEYGAYLADIGSGFAVYAMHPMSSRTNPYRGVLPDRAYPSLDRIPFGRMRVLKLPPVDRNPDIELVPNRCASFR